MIMLQGGSLLWSHRRHAVILPWGNPPAADAPGKELYIVPLKPLERPEYLELLDHLSLPPSRSEILLVGVFILHKSKQVTHPASYSVASAAAPASAAFVPTPLLSPSSLGFDLSALTPEFIADLLRTNPAISAAAAAAFAAPQSTDAHPVYRSAQISSTRPPPQNSE